MTERQHNLDFGTIGSAPCEIALNRILIDLNDAKVTRKIMGRFHRLREQLELLKVLRETASRGFFKSMAKMVYEDHKAKFQSQRATIPENVFTHALCCYKAVYRRAILEEWR